MAKLKLSWLEIGDIRWLQQTKPSSSCRGCRNYCERINKL